MRGWVSTWVRGCVVLPGCGGPRWWSWVVGIRSRTGRGPKVEVLGGGSKVMGWTGRGPKVVVLGGLV